MLSLGKRHSRDSKCIKGGFANSSVFAATKFPTIYSPVKDFPNEDENAEFYCDICEEHRYLLDPTYYCKECHFVSHVHCVNETSEEMNVLAEEWSLPIKLERQKNADKQGPALEGLASVDEATGISVEECKAEGSRVAENRLSILKQDEEIAVLHEEILRLETKLSAMHERKEKLERRRASNFLDLLEQW